MRINLGENIKRLRQEKGLTQESLAAVLGITFQSVSKWERNESYPDITLLPEIASFFGISVDELLGVDKKADEEEITKALNEYDSLRDEWHNEKKKLEILEKVREKYPSDFRVQLKLLRHIITYEYRNADKAKVMSLYNNIQANCTDDSIRIAAKNHYISYCLGMSSIKDSGITTDDAYKIIEELPSMKDCREALAFAYLPCELTENTDYTKVHDAIEETVDMLYSLLSGIYLNLKMFSADYRIKAIEKTIEFFDFIYDDGNYGRMWTIVISCCYGILGLFYYEKGDYEKALASLKKSAELAVKFDSMPRYTVMSSRLFNGRTFDKHSLGSDLDIKKKMKESFLVHYNFSEEFKNSDEFKNIIKMLG